MRKFFTAVSFLILFKISYAEEYYYYKGSQIVLERRPDKAAVILNSDNFTIQACGNILGKLNSLGYASHKVRDNILLTDLNQNGKTIENLTNDLAGFSSGNFVKFITPVYFGESHRVTQIPSDEFIVRLKYAKDSDKLALLNSMNNVQIVGKVTDDRGFVLRSYDNVKMNALKLSSVYYNSGLFEYAEPNFVYPDYCLLNYSPNDFYYPKQWALNNTGQTVQTGDSSNGDVPNVQGIPGADMEVNLAWDFTMGNSSITIGIFDTGIDSTHPDFNAAGHIRTGYDACFDKYGVPKDSGNFGGHGTCCAGLAAALINNSIGVAGVAPECKLMAFRIFDQLGSLNTVVIARAFDTARVAGVDVISNSWNGFTPVSLVTDAIENAAINGRGGLGCIILFSSGNDGHNSVWYPSYINEVISVGASTPHDQKKAPGTGNQFAWGGNYGEDAKGDVDVVAPAICYTTDIQGAFGYNHLPGAAGNYYATFSGTSSSCPNTAGIVALMLSVNPSLTRIQAMEYLYRGCDKIENVPYSIAKPYGRWNDYCGYGKVNAFNSVRLAAGVDVTPPTIVHKNVYSHSSTFPTKIFAEIIDQDGTPVPTDGVNQPKIFFRRNFNNSVWTAFDSLDAFGFVGNNFEFHLPCAGYETQFQYYIRARDFLGNETTFPKGAPNNFWLCYFAVGSLVSESNKIEGFTCLDPGITLSPAITFPNFTIVDTRVELYLEHQSLADEIIFLNSPLSDPNNNRKCLFSSNGGGANIHGAMVTDSANQFWISGVAPYFNGSFKGDYILNGLNGYNAQGDWKIMNYDQHAGNQGYFDSVRITFTRTSGAPRPCARLDTPQDSLVDFGTVIYPDSLLKEFYVRNTGNADLGIYELTLNGNRAQDFALESTIPISIPPNDSGLILLKLKPPADTGSMLHSNIVYNVEMDLTTDDPSKQNFPVTLTYNTIILPVELSSFNSVVAGRNVTLNWETAEEINNKGFDVERKLSSEAESAWKKIRFLNGAGNTTAPTSYSFTDRNLESGIYQYRLKQMDFNGAFRFYNLGNDVTLGIPSKFDLSQNYPNPFNPSTRINFDLPSDAKVDIRVYDLSGREMKTLLNEFRNAGYYTLEFNAGGLASGIYFYVMRSGNFVEAKKMVLIK